MDAAGFSYVGENLYKAVGMHPTGVDVVDAWYAELEDYTYGEVGNYCVKSKCVGRRSPPCVFGHFTQVSGSNKAKLGLGWPQLPASILLAIALNVLVSQYKS